MSASRFLLILSVISAGVLSACTEPGTYPITGAEISQDDPVQEMYNPGLIFRGESR